MEINFETKFAVPPLFHRYERDDWTLLFDPRGHAFVRVNSQGLAVVEALMRHPRLGDAVEYLAESFAMDVDQVAEPVMQFSVDLAKSDFLHLGEYKWVVHGNADAEGLKPPESIYIQNTERCNLSCVYCYNLKERAYFVKEHPEMSTEKLKWAIDQIADFGIRQINFCGGESTLRDDLLECAAHARARGRLVALVTNGQKDTDEFTTEAARLFDVIWVSIDSYNKEIAERHRGKGSYAPAIRSIKKLVQVPNKRARITVSAVYSHLNWEEMDEFRRICLEDLGVDRFRSTTYCPGCASSGEADWPLKPPPFVRDSGIPLPGSMNVSDLADLFDYDFRVEYDAINKKLKPKAGWRDHCGVGAGELAMLSNGDVFPCQLLCKPQYLAGNLFEQPLAEIFRTSPILQRMRRLTVESIPGCATCDVKNICVGGCRAIALELHGSDTAHNEYLCDLYRRIAVEALWRDSMIPVDKIEEARTKYEVQVAEAVKEREELERRLEESLEHSAA